MQQFLRRHHSQESHSKILIRVYANTRGLEKLLDNDIGDGPPVVIDRFVRDFNMANPLSDFIDAGNGKECADEKLRGEGLPSCLMLNLTDRSSNV